MLVYVWSGTALWSNISAHAIKQNAAVVWSNDSCSRPSDSETAAHLTCKVCLLDLAQVNSCRQLDFTADSAGTLLEP